MFEQLFSRPGTIGRYASAPLVDCRVRYLAHCAASGAKLSTLRKIANHQIEAVRLLKLRDGDRVDLSRIEAAAGEWSRPRPVRHGGPASPGGEAVFAAHTVRWLRFLGWLDLPERERHPNAPGLPRSRTGCGGNAACPSTRSARATGRRTSFSGGWTTRGFLSKRSASRTWTGSRPKRTRAAIASGPRSMPTRSVFGRFSALRNSGTGARRAWPGRSCRPASTWTRRCPRAWRGRMSSACWRRLRATGPGTNATAPSCCCSPCTACDPARWAASGWTTSTGTRRRCASAAPSRGGFTCIRCPAASGGPLSAMCARFVPAVPGAPCSSRSSLRSGRSARPRYGALSASVCGASASSPGTADRTCCGTPAPSTFWTGACR